MYSGLVNILGLILEDKTGADVMVANKKDAKLWMYSMVMSNL